MNVTIVTSRTTRRAALPVLFLLKGHFFGFSSKLNLAVRSLRAKFHLDRLKGVGLQPQKFDNLEFY